jgi:hypothetical protein
MVTFRTLLLQLVFVVQFISLPVSNGGKTFQPSENKIRTELQIQCESYSITNKPINQLDSFRIVETRCINSPIVPRETPAKCLVQPSIISKENLPVKTNSLEKKNPPRKVSASSFIRIALAGDTQLF